MKIIVQKFGGTSVESSEKRSKILEHIQKAQRENFKIVVVVSAMGRKPKPYATDSLLALAPNINSREKDLLLSCGEIISAVVLSSLLNDNNIPNIVLNGAQAGIITNNNYTDSKILKIDTTRIKNYLNDNKIVIVTGFQGSTSEGEVTTLGRGGSDITATALGQALRAERVDIFTDVAGIMTADPRVEENATKINKVTYSEVCNLSFQGAKVIHPHSVEFAMRGNIPVRIRDTMSDEPGTLIGNFKSKVQSSVTGITHMTGITQIKIKLEYTKDDALFLKIFELMANNNISVDFININPSEIVYTVDDKDLDITLKLVQDLQVDYCIQKDCSKVSVVGSSISGVPGIMSKIISSLSEKEIRILQTADSHTTIWVLVLTQDMKKAVKALHHKFRLDKGV